MKQLDLKYSINYFAIKIIGFLIVTTVFYSCKNRVVKREIQPFCASEYCSESGKKELIKLYQNTKNETDSIYFNIHCIITTKKSPKFFKIEDKIKKLNQIFSSAKIQFKLLPIITHSPKNVNLDEIERKKSLRSQVTRGLESKKAINLFIVPHGENLNGFTLVIPDKFSTYSNLLNCNTIFISDEAWFNPSTLAHEFGHFFGLQHTFGKSPIENTTLEKPDGSNCLYEGDFICDTPADPNGIINKNCEYIGLSTGQKNYFKPMVNNYMSYYLSLCKNKFTEDQYISMNFFANKYRKYLKIKSGE